MSRTYKTDPLWVQIKKNRKGDFPIKHNHNSTDECVEGYWEGNGYWRYGTPFAEQDITCYPRYSYYSSKHLPYRNRPPVYSAYAKNARRKTRTATRNALATAKNLSPDDFEDFDLPEQEFHHGAIWWLIF
jgi:hypothetical protein